MKNILVILLFGFVFNMTYATPTLNKDKDNPEHQVVYPEHQVVYTDIVADGVFVANFTDNDFNEYSGDYSESVSDTVIIIKEGTKFMIIDYFPMNERIQNSNLYITMGYKPNSKHFIKTLKALRKIPDTINEVQGSSGGLPLS